MFLLLEREGGRLSSGAGVATALAMLTASCSCGMEATSSTDDGQGGATSSATGSSVATGTSTTSGSGGAPPSGWSTVDEGLTPCPLYRPDRTAELPEMTLVACTLAGWSGCRKWEPEWERSAYSAIIDTRFDSRSTPVRVGALLFPEDNNMAVSYRLPGGAPEVAIRSAATCFLSPLVPAGTDSSWLVVGNVESGGTWGHYSLSADYKLDKVGFDATVELTVGEAGGNEWFLGGVPLSGSTAHIWDNEQSMAHSVPAGLGGSVFGVEYLTDGVLFTLVEADKSTRVVFQKQGGQLVQSVVQAAPNRYVLQAVVRGGNLIWTESTKSPADGAGAGAVMTAPWSSVGPFPLAGTEVGQLDPVTIFAASENHLVTYNLQQAALDVMQLSDGVVTSMPSPATGNFFRGLKFVGDDGLGGEALWVNTHDALYRLAF